MIGFHRIESSATPLPIPARFNIFSHRFSGLDLRWRSSFVSVSPCMISVGSRAPSIPSWLPITSGSTFRRRYFRESSVFVETVSRKLKHSIFHLVTLWSSQIVFEVLHAQRCLYAYGIASSSFCVSLRPSSAQTSIPLRSKFRNWTFSGL